MGKKIIKIRPRSRRAAAQEEWEMYKEVPAWWLMDRMWPKKDQMTAEKKSKNLKFKKKRGVSPYFAFLDKNHADIKATLVAQADEGARISVADVIKVAYDQWNELKGAIDAAEKRIVAGEDLDDDERSTYKDKLDEMAEYVAASDASKKEAAEYNRAKAKKITNARATIADSQQTPLVDFNFASEPVSSTQLVDNELADITFDTAPHDIPRDVWELF